MKRKSVLPVFILLFLFACKIVYGQNTQNEFLVSFYNLENLFDTVNNDDVQDSEYTPEGRREWNTKRYQNKLDKLSEIISDIGSDDGFEKGPDVLGVCEVENKGVLEDLVRHEGLAKNKFQIVHYNSPERRGVDVALLYKKKNFKLIDSRPYALYLTDPITGDRIYTRDQLLVVGEFKKSKVHIIVNHWPSRWGGELRSRPLRLAAAQLSRHIADSLLKTDSLAKIIFMGDFNDDPTNQSIEKYLYASVDSTDLEENQLYNTSAPLFLDEKGSLLYRGKWNMFDQIIISQALLNPEKKGLGFNSFKVVTKDYLFQRGGKFEGYPLRTFGGKTYLNGYSDHLPVYMILKLGN